MYEEGINMYQPEKARHPLRQRQATQTKEQDDAYRKLEVSHHQPKQEQDDEP